MKRIIGWGVGVVYIVIASAVFAFASRGRADGHGEIGFWFSVVGTFLSVAALAAFIGTWIHTQDKSKSTPAH
jgi:hypothetical protein